MALALQAQQDGDFVEALRRYDQHLALVPGDFDALHMRAVALFQLGCIEESQAAFRELMARYSALPRPAWTNLGLVTAAMHGSAESARASTATHRYQAWKAKVDRTLRASLSSTAGLPAIGVVMASFNHAPFVAQALESVADQTRLPQELIVIDDGSCDGSQELIRQVLGRFPSCIRVEFVARENRGAAASLNEAIGRLSTPWVAPLNSDDLFDRNRLQRLGDAAARLQPLGTEFMFGGIDLIDTGGLAMRPPYSPFARSVMESHRSFLMHHSIGLGLLSANCTISSGNQFFTRRLWEQLGGYKPLRYNHDWDFALRASGSTEPVHLPDARYRYRIHDSNTIAKAGHAARSEARALLQSFLSSARTDRMGALAPSYENWGPAFLAVAGCVDALPDLSSQDAGARFMCVEGAPRA